MSLRAVLKAFSAPIQRLPCRNERRSPETLGSVKLSLACASESFTGGSASLIDPGHWLAVASPSTSSALARASSPSARPTSVVLCAGRRLERYSGKLWGGRESGVGSRGLRPATAGSIPVGPAWRKEAGADHPTSHSGGQAGYGGTSSWRRLT